MLRILLVEDSASDVELLELALEDSGLAFELQVACSAAELRDALRDFAADVAISDMNLPGFNGHAALALVEEQRPGIPRILLTGVDTGEPVATGIRIIEKSRLAELVALLAAMATP